MLRDRNAPVFAGFCKTPAPSVRKIAQITKLFRCNSAAEIVRLRIAKDRSFPLYSLLVLELADRSGKLVPLRDANA